ncbi:MAG TPA: hypothetical protein VFZ73_05455 [Gemmatimonadaceae bacterium]
MRGFLFFMRRRVLSVSIAPVALVLASCSGGDGPSEPQPVLYGSLLVTINGLPNGAPASVTVTGPGSFSRTISATTTLTQLSAGSYTVTVGDVTHEGSTYSGAPASQSYDLAAGAEVTTPTVTYALATGALSLTMVGLPQSAGAVVVISGPENYSRTVSGPTEIVGLKPGQYSVEAREVQLTGARYAATPGTQQVTISPSPTPAVAHVVYALATGILQINIQGLPQGSAASVTVSGPGNYSRSLTEETVLENLTPGNYQVSAQHVVAGSVFTAAPATQSVQVSAVSEPAVANITYVSAGTSLSVQISGLPGSLPAKVTLTGPNGYSRQIAGTEVISSLAAGTYTLAAQAVTQSCASYAPVPASQVVTINPGQGAAATVTYSSGAGGANLCIEGAYITQSVQAFDGSVPLVAGRAGLLRVFVRASGTNAAQPSVRARFYNSSGALVQTIMIGAPTASVPADVDEGTLTSSWNTPLSASFLQPGLRMLVDVDPGNAISEPNENDNVFPLGGQPLTLDVRTVSTMRVSLVPVVQSARGDTGRVSSANLGDFILPMQQMFPVANIDADVRPPYTYTGAELQSGGTNWITLLSEINALRVTEATGRMYYGVVRVGYTSGVAGLGYIGLPASIGWDHQPSGAGVMAHELGHNFGRLHAPCGNPSGVDNQFPYTGAGIGVFGYDILTGNPKSSSQKDLMSYCNPPWISDYTYSAILNFRASAYPATGPSQARLAPAQRGLLVWGRIDQGRVVLEPAIEVDAPPSMPTRNGAHRVEAFGPNGQTLFSFSFDGDRVADSPDATDQTFAFVVPVSQLRGQSLARLRLLARGRQAELRSAGGGVVPTATRTAPGRVRVTWNANAARMAMIRDARSGRILSFSRGGAVDLRTASDDLEITVSDGVQSTRSRIRPR